MSRMLDCRSTMLSAALFGVLVIGVGSVAASAQTPEKGTGVLVQSHGQWRATELNGATVYNDEGSSIGTINDLLVGSEGKIDNVVLSVGGFLGVGSRYVEVPFSKLKFQPSKSNPAAATGATTAARNANDQDYSVMLPGVTKQALTAMTAFTY